MRKDKNEIRNRFHKGNRNYNLNHYVVINKGEEEQMKITSFDFWQKFGKALLVVVAVMPAAGLMISIGKLIGMSAGDINAVHTIARVMEDIGWAIITNLHILFAVAIGDLGRKIAQVVHLQRY